MDKKSLCLKVENRKKGSLGEKIAEKFLINKGFFVCARNYRKPWGEIDIIAQKDKILHFIEVKSVTSASLHQPEENVHELKLRKIRRMVETYFFESESDNAEFQFHVLCVYIVESRKIGRVKWIKNIIL